MNWKERFMDILFTRTSMCGFYICRKTIEDREDVKILFLTYSITTIRLTTLIVKFSLIFCYWHYIYKLFWRIQNFQQQLNFCHSYFIYHNIKCYQSRCGK